MRAKRPKCDYSRVKGIFSNCFPCEVATQNGKWKIAFFGWKGVIGFEKGVIIGHAAKNIQYIC